MHIPEEKLRRHPFRAGFAPCTITNSFLSTRRLSSLDSKVCLKLQSTWSLTLANFNEGLWHLSLLMEAPTYRERERERESGARASEPKGEASD